MRAVSILVLFMIICSVVIKTREFWYRNADSPEFRPDVLVIGKNTNTDTSLEYFDFPFDLFGQYAPEHAQYTQHVKDTKLVVFPFGQKANVSSYYSFFWDMIEDKKWGTNLFNSLHRIFLSIPDPIYIGVGEWIGPILLFATFYAEVAFGLEPQPESYELLFENALLNQESWKANKHVLISRLCIQHPPDTFKPPIGWFWNATFVGKPFSDEPYSEYSKYNVTCTSLETYVDYFVLPFLRLPHAASLGSRLVIKIDIEGEEGNWLSHPSFRNWLSTDFKPWQKPTFIISVHPSAFKGTTLENTMQVIRLFRYVSRYDELDFIQKPTDEMESQDPCFKDDFYCDLILSDITFSVLSN